MNSLSGLASAMVGTIWGPSVEAGRGPLEWVVDAGKHGGPVASVTDIHVPHHRRSCDATKPDPTHFVQGFHRESSAVVEDITDIHEGRHLDLHVGNGIERKGSAPQLHARGERVSVVEPPITETSQGLLATDLGLPASQAAQRPEW